MSALPVTTVMERKLLTALAIALNDCPQLT